ncbi:Mediator of RNA polymerase II transcription subunit 17 [Halotydeus destructor]|nr:Mediator of RNA polymerase II transcription subunit 17 [Halotydeus destructor]KAI1302377.1 Mediator of RNA polymerase II transcription subunit 17 [Halotydeus destructor]
MMSSLSVNVSLEAPDEYQIQEITYDGQEKCIQPLSMSENMVRLAHRIDFNETDETESTEKNEVSENDSKELVSFQPSLWPWDSVRSKLRSAFTEVSVLLDVLNITKDKRYMVLDPVQQDNVTDYRPVQALIAKKKALASTALIIINGADRLKAAQSDATRNRSADFHSELMTMRQNWRMRKVGNSIFGDLSYRSAGSRYPHTGTFEIAKNEAVAGAPVPTTPGGSITRTSALKVTVPSELEGLSYIHVSIQKSNETLASADLTIPVPPGAVSTWESSWQQKLENAHNVLFCKELFAQLAREAVQLQLPIPTLVMNNQIVATLFPGVQLSIGLCHSTVQNKKSQKPANQSPSSRKEHHKPVLEHSLHQLLREFHYNALHQPMPHPTTATLGMNKKHYLAGPLALDKQTLIESCQSETMLEQIIAQSQHVVLRMRTLHMIDTLAREVEDPIVVAHWTCLNCPTKSSVKLNIVSYGYETLSRAPFVVHVGTNSLKAVIRDGRVLHMSYESQELRYLILSQVSQHQVMVVQALAKIMGWKILSLTNNCGVGPVEMIGTASSVVLASPNGQRLIAMRHGPESGVHVSVSLSPHEQDFYPSTLVRDIKWQNITGAFKEVALDKLEGRNLVSKMEYLMASLTQC